jgi:NADH-quinone oxidoreductase subunit L
MLTVTWLVIALPLLGFVVLVATGRRLGEPWAGWLATAMVTASFLVAIGLYLDLLGIKAPVRSYSENLWTWLDVGGLNLHAGLYVDPLSMTMVLFVTGVSALIHLYSIGYMHGDKDFAKFFLYLNLFVASMLILVLGSNMVMTFIGWEGVGTCSYWLVSFWFERNTAAVAGKKAFLYNRLGDVGFMLAMFLTFENFHSLDYSTIFARVDSVSSLNITVICLLLVVAVMGKSAQIPLFPWLADAMEGPTPVSALIHAATMVTAGVYLLCRVHPLLHASPTASLVVAIMGAVTAFVGATIACAQQDIKKVLAYSTISQLGYMFLAIGCGAYTAAIFLMVAHAFFKALLFLGSGSVIHGLHGEQDLRRMGNLRQYMPITFITFAIGWLAIAAVPPLSGFWAKGDILDNAFAARPVLWGIGVFTAALTAYYMSRLTSLAFFGSDRWGQKHPVDPDPWAHHAEVGEQRAPVESPLVMTLPLWILAFFAATAGLLATSGNLSLSAWVDPVFGSSLFSNHLPAGDLWVLGLLDTVVALGGVALGIWLWVSRTDRPALEIPFLRNAWYVNEAYDTLLGRPSTRLAHFSAEEVDLKVIDGAVNSLAGLVRGAGRIVAKTQTGYLRNYALAMVGGVVLILAFMLTRMWWG